MQQIKTIIETLVTGATSYMPQIIAGTSIFLIFLILAFLAGIIFNKIIKNQKKDRKNIFIFFKRLSRSTIIIFALITMLGTWGIDISALVAGLGLTGFALGFAFKDAVSSTLAGILVLLYEPFKIGDIIDVCGVKGEVISIDMRYTSLKDDKTFHLIPNAKLFTEKISILEKL